MRGCADEVQTSTSKISSLLFTLSGIARFFSNDQRGVMATTMAERYRYLPLQHSESIRILELLPGLSDSPLRCRLIEYKAGEGVSYEALSYTWNSNILDHAILVEDAVSPGVLPITKNLHDAFQALRKPDQACTLWADAVCIDQSDAKDKSNQVPRMGNIFHDADRVIVWLGSDSAGNSDTVNALLQVSSWSEHQLKSTDQQLLGLLMTDFIRIPW